MAYLKIEMKHILLGITSIFVKKSFEKNILNKRNFLRPAPITHFELSSYIFHKSLCKFFCTKLCSAISMTFLKWELNYCDGIE